MMLASELIQKLQALIDAHGDFPVVAQDYGIMHHSAIHEHSIRIATILSQTDCNALEQAIVVNAVFVVV